MENDEHETKQGTRIKRRETQRIIVSQSVPPVVLAGTQPRLVPLSRTLKRLGATVVDEIAGPGFSVASEGDPDLVIVADVTPEVEERLMAAKPPNVHVERSQKLSYGFVPLPPRQQDPGLLPLSSEGFQSRIVITDMADTGVPEVEIFAIGELWTHRAMTDQNGVATLDVFGDTPQMIQSLIIRPRKNLWSRFIDLPDLQPDGRHVVSVRGIATAAERGVDLGGWGLRTLGVDQLPADVDGRGVRIAVIDSGLASAHRDLDNIVTGETVVDDDPEAWRIDPIGHGSHVAGVIGARANLRGMRSIAPGAEIIPIKLFPGGQTEQLVHAINRAVALNVDVVNLSLGMQADSPVVADCIRRAREVGVAVIAAAGNSAGPVMFPARMPEVFAVSAFGKSGTFPPDSYHSQQRAEDATGRPIGDTHDGLFFSKFSCFGPEIDVTAPGVAIVSSVPEDGYQSMDGTSMACPHVAAIAALALSARDEFVAGEFSARSASRVDALFRRLRESCRAPIGLGSPEQVGSGIPDARLLMS